MWFGGSPAAAAATAWTRSSAPHFAHSCPVSIRVACTSAGSAAASAESRFSRRTHRELEAASAAGRLYDWRLSMYASSESSSPPPSAGAAPFAWPLAARGGGSGSASPRSKYASSACAAASPSFAAGAAASASASCGSASEGPGGAEAAALSAATLAWRLRTQLVELCLL